jgi:hypothetical protein
MYLPTIENTRFIDTSGKTCSPSQNCKGAIMGRLTIIVGVCLLATVCLGQEESTYHNPDYHFSFVLPEGWETIENDDLPVQEKSLIESTFEKSMPVALCQKIDGKYLSPPYILVLFRSTEEVPESEVEKLFSQGDEIMMLNLKKRILLLQEAEGAYPNSWKGAKEQRAEVNYDRDRHILFETARLQHQRIGEAIAVTVKALGSHRMVTLHCFGDERSSRDFLDLVNSLVDSFSFDEGYGFGESGGLAGTTRKLSKKVWYWIGPGGVILILVLLLGRWARR